MFAYSCNFAVYSPVATQKNRNQTIWQKFTGLILKGNWFSKSAIHCSAMDCRFWRSRNTASRLPVALPSSASANQHFKLVQKCSKTPKNCGFSGFFYCTSSVAACLILAGFELFWPCFSWLKMGQPALFDPIMIKKWGNREPKSSRFWGAFTLSLVPHLRAFRYGFSFERAVLICQDLTKLNSVYLFFLMPSKLFEAGECLHICATRLWADTMKAKRRTALWGSRNSR